MANQASKKQNYLTFEALNDGVKLLYTRGTSTFQYSADLGKSWQNWLPETYSPILNVGDKLLVKCVNPTIDSTNGMGRITSDQAAGYNYKVSGDIMSMIFGDDAAIHYSLKGYDRCFNNFLYSSRLLDAGDLVLKATELAPYCYNQLLYGCNNNNRLPKELPAENLATNCYRYFSNGGLYTEMPIIKATSANSYNFYAFLLGSKNITKIDLSSIKKISGNRPLDAAFKNCSALNYIKIGWKQWANPSSLSKSWVEGVASQGTFVIPDNAEFDPEEIRGVNGIPEGWDVYTESEWEEINSLTESDKAINTILKSIIQGTDLNDINTLFATINSSGEDYSAINQELKEIILNGYEPIEDYYLTIEALENDLTVSFSTNTIQYSTDNCQTWIELPADTATPAINTGDMISFKASGLVPEESAGIGTFTVNKNFNLKGNAMSMLFGDEGKNSYDLTGYTYAFYGLFNECYTLQSVSKNFLPATKLADSCYAHMFYGCSSLVTAPQLPATKLADSCYENMFEGSSLVTAPELPATILANNCYSGMFYSCTSLVTAPELPATILAPYCYSYMFSSCPLVASPALPATTLADNCYYSMFETTDLLPDCTNIDFTSESVVASGGLQGLFAWTNVTDEDLYNILPINPATGKYWLPATTLADWCYASMFQGCESLVTAPELPATTLADYCYDSMFAGCSIVTAPELPATTLAEGCYQYMFDSCQLVTAPELPATILAPYCYSYMFSGCSSLTTAPELPATTLVEGCYSQMFSGCVSLNYIKALFATDPDSGNYTYDWVAGVSPTGAFVKNANATWDVTGPNGIPEEWTVELEVAQISFTIEGIQYYAEEGMFWEDWVNSEYNTGEYKISGGLGARPIETSDGNGYIVGEQDRTIPVFTDDFIINNYNYYITQY